MSDDNKNSEQPFDFDFDALNEDESQEKPGDSAFDLDNPFGDDIVVTRSEPGESSAKPGDSAFDLDNPFGDDLAPLSGESEVSADNPYLDDSAADSFAEESAGEESSEIDASEVPSIDAGEEATGKKKKGFLAGLFGGGKKKSPKEKTSKDKKAKEKQPKAKKEKKEKAPKEGESSDKPAVPRDLGTILCIAFSVFLLVSLLMFNVATLLTYSTESCRECLNPASTLMGTLCFLGAFNIVGLVLIAIPVLFYKFPQERTLPNVMLGLSVGAMFSGVLFQVNNFYQYYGFAISP